MLMLMLMSIRTECLRQAIITGYSGEQKQAALCTVVDDLALGNLVVDS